MQVLDLDGIRVFTYLQHGLRVALLYCVLVDLPRHTTLAVI